MEIAGFDALRSAADAAIDAAWLDALRTATRRRLAQRMHGDLPRWERALARLPRPRGVDCRLDTDVVCGSGGLDRVDMVELAAALRALHPWRKGPFRLHGVDIDAEWRSDLKWQRLVAAVSPLDGRRVLDVGCGNGYYLWRMLGAGARLALGIDPSQLFWVQFRAVRRLLGDAHPASVMPLALEDAPPGAGCFDTVFSMGVLYHRRAPLEHLLTLKDMLRTGGELVLETLVVDGDEYRLLVPEDRYAQMRNVWFIPSVPMLERWLRRCGYGGVRTIDVSRTRTTEQRTTPWMRFDSLQDFLDPADADRTIEGYPAPRRAILVATMP